MPEQKSVNLSYQNATSPLGGSYTQNKLAKLRLPPFKNKSFLDLGCNAGFYCKLAQDGGATRVVGVDVDKKVIAQARLNHPNIEFFDGGWDVFPEGKFDVIICLSAIHYAKTPIKLARDIWEHLNDNGLFILEGGLIDAAGQCQTNILIPGWRTVGDRCRHVSHGFATSYLLRNFDWKIIGPSEPRGGDNVPRHVIHAVRSAAQSENTKPFYVDLLEYAHGLALSSQTIAPAQPSYDYVRALGQTPINRASLETLLANNAYLAAFTNDLLFALQGFGPVKVQFNTSVSATLLQSITSVLSAKGVSIV